MLLWYASFYIEMLVALKNPYQEAGGTFLESVMHLHQGAFQADSQFIYRTTSSVLKNDCYYWNTSLTFQVKDDLANVKGSRQPSSLYLLRLHRRRRRKAMSLDFTAYHG